MSPSASLPKLRWDSDNARSVRLSALFVWRVTERWGKAFYFPVNMVINGRGNSKGRYPSKNCGYSLAKRPAEMPACEIVYGTLACWLSATTRNYISVAV